MAKSSQQADSARLLKRLGITLNRELLKQSLTHRSYAYEHPGTLDNERLEFLGDAVLGRAVTLLLYQRYPDVPEGDLAQRRASLVSTQALAGIAQRIGLGEYLFLGRGEENSGGRQKDSLLANTVEALIGAHFLSEGDPHSEAFVRSLVEPLLNEQEHSGKQVVDSKTLLQEYAAAKGHQPPTYRVTGSGPDHDRVFRAEALLDKQVVGVGTGTSKKQAELQAAGDALEKLSVA